MAGSGQVLLTGLVVLTAVRWGDCAQGCEAGCAPMWELPEPSVKRLNKMAGETAYFRCRAFGNPRPSVTWIKDGRRLTPHDKKVRMVHDAISIPRLRPGDTGVYKCVVENRFGLIEWSFELTVYGHEQQIGLGGQGRPKNVTSYVGRSAIFRCDVTTDDAGAAVTWVKLKDTITAIAEDVHEHVIKSKDFWGSDTLVVPTVTLNDTGLYTCIVNTSSQTMQMSAWLTVLPNPNPRLAGVRQRTGDTTPAFITYLKGLGVSVGTLVGLFLVGLLLVSGVAFYRNWRKLDGDSSTSTAAELTKVKPIEI